MQSRPSKVALSECTQEREVRVEGALAAVLGDTGSVRAAGELVQCPSPSASLASYRALALGHVDMETWSPRQQAV